MTAEISRSRLGEMIEEIRVLLAKLNEKIDLLLARIQGNTKQKVENAIEEKVSVTITDLLKDSTHKTMARNLQQALSAVSVKYEKATDKESRIIHAVAKFLETADIKGDKDGHIHGKEKLITKALADSGDLYSAFTHDEDLQKRVFENDDFQRIQTMFDKLHHKLAHNGHHHHH